MMIEPIDNVGAFQSGNREDINQSYIDNVALTMPAQLLLHSNPLGLKCNTRVKLRMSRTR